MWVSEVKVCQSWPALCDPMNYLWPHELYIPWNSPGQNTGVGRLSLLQGIFPTQGLNPGLPHCRQILNQLSHKGNISEVTDISPWNPDSSLCFSLAFHMLYSAYKLNKQGDNIWPWRTPLLIWSQSVPYPVLTVAPWPAYRSLRRWVSWSGTPICLRIFHVVVIHKAKDFNLVNKKRSRCFPKFSCFFYDPTRWFSSVQLLSRVWFFATSWTAACQAPLSITNSQSPPKPMSIESVMPYNHLTLCHPLLLLPSIFPNISLFKWVSSLHRVAKVLEFQLQHQSYQWTPRTDLL